MECLNQSNDHDLEACLTNDENYLESDCDEQVIHVTFVCVVFILSDSFRCSWWFPIGPKTQNIINQPKNWKMLHKIVQYETQKVDDQNQNSTQMKNLQILHVS